MAILQDGNKYIKIENIYGSKYHGWFGNYTIYEYNPSIIEYNSDTAIKLNSGIINAQYIENDIPYSILYNTYQNNNINCISI